MPPREPTRRQFLTETSVTAGALLAPSLLMRAGPRRRPSPGERVTLGHIGVGGRGRSLLGEFLRVPEARSVAVCDCFTSRREAAIRTVDEHYSRAEAKGSSSGCRAHADFRELLARDDVDAVVIATPDHWHVPIALAAVRAGKDVYVEKPLGVAVSWNRALRETVGRYGAVFQYGTQQRSGSDFRLACELVRNGRIGSLERIDVWCSGMFAPGWYEEVAAGGGSTTPIPVPEDLDYDTWIGPAPMSPYTEDRCTEWGSYHVYDNALGFIAGWGAHPLDIAQWGAGTDHTAPVEYEATGRVNEEGLFDTTFEWDVHARYASGVRLHFMNTRKAMEVVTYRPFHDHGTTFFGPDGWVSVDRGGLHVSDPALLATPIGTDEIRLHESANHCRDFVLGVRRRAATASPVGAAFQSDLISHLSDVCIRTGRKITWDPEHERIVDDEAAARMLDRPLRSPWQL